MNENDLQIIDNKKIQDCIVEIRGKQVMLDSDIAYYFGTETKYLNKQMKRNINRFPDDFCFKLNSLEFKNLRFQNATANNCKKRFYPYVYTEHGILALAGVIKNETASRMSVEIVRKFVEMRNFFIQNQDVLLTLARIQNKQIELEITTDKRFDEVFKLFKQYDLPKQKVFFDGQFYDSFEFISSLVETAEQEIILIDTYFDSHGFTFFKSKKPNVKLLIYRGSNNKDITEELIKFEKQYGPVELFNIEDFHNRYLIIDNKTCYSLGTSLNRMGSKIIDITKMDDFVIELLKARLK